MLWCAGDEDDDFRVLSFWPISVLLARLNGDLSMRSDVSGHLKSMAPQERGARGSAQATTAAASHAEATRRLEVGRQALEKRLASTHARDSITDVVREKTGMPRPASTGDPLTSARGGDLSVDVP